MRAARETETDGQGDRHRVRTTETERQTDNERDAQTGRQTGRQAGRYVGRSRSNGALAKHAIAASETAKQVNK